MNEEERNKFISNKKDILERWGNNPCLLDYWDRKYYHRIEDDLGWLGLLEDFIYFPDEELETLIYVLAEIKTQRENKK